MIRSNFRVISERSLEDIPGTVIVTDNLADPSNRAIELAQQLGCSIFIYKLVRVVHPPAGCRIVDFV